MLMVNLETNQDTLAASCWSLSYANNYMNGGEAYPPHYPLPVKTDTDTNIYHQWFSNDDGYWTRKPWLED